MSSTAERRKEYKYRDKYIKHNKGTFFKGEYICAICHKSIREDNMEVDHIIPLSKFGPNHVINCVATCTECNRAKSDNFDTTILIKEVLWKVFEELIIGTKWCFSSLFKLLRYIINYPINLAETSRGKVAIYLIYLIIIVIVLCEMGV